MSQRLIRNFVVLVIGIQLVGITSCSNQSQPSWRPTIFSTRVYSRGAYENKVLDDVYFAESYYRIKIDLDRALWEREDSAAGALRKIGIDAGDEEIRLQTEELLVSFWDLYYTTLKRSCQLGMLTDFVISNGTLQERLDALKPSMRQRGLVFSFPEDERFQEQLRMRSLTACEIEPDTIHMTLKVPVKRKNVQYKVEEVVRLSDDLSHLDVCHLEGDPSVTHILYRDEERFPITARMEYGCQLTEIDRSYVWTTPLCFIPEHARVQVDCSNMYGFVDYNTIHYPQG